MNSLKHILLLNLMLSLQVVELKRLFKGSMNLEDFHSKALRLVKEAEYPEEATQDRILRDTLISGLAFDKICAKIIKEGKHVILARVMETAIDWKFPHKNILAGCKTLQKLIMFSMERDRRKESQNLVVVKVQQTTVAAVETVAVLEALPNPVERARKFHIPTDICWRCGKGRHQKGQPCKAMEAVCRNCFIK